MNVPGSPLPVRFIQAENSEAMDQFGNPAPIGAQSLRQRSASVRHALWRFLEMQIPMVLGAVVCYLLVNLIPASSDLATIYYPGSYLFTAGDTLYLTLPVVAWMIFRGHGGRDSLEMAVAMLAPVAAIIVLGEMGGYAYRLWLLTAGYPAMCLGMLVYMLHRTYGYAHGA